MSVSFCLPHPVPVNAFIIYSGLCPCNVVNVSFGSKVRFSWLNIFATVWCRHCRILCSFHRVCLCFCMLEVISSFNSLRSG